MIDYKQRDPKQMHSRTTSRPVAYKLEVFGKRTAGVSGKTYRNIKAAKAAAEKIRQQQHATVHVLDAHTFARVA